MRLRSKIGRWRRNRQRVRYRDPLCYGLDFIGEVAVRLPKLQLKTIFDVGAWYGITAMQFSDAFPDATVYAFEPVKGNFERMRHNLSGKPQVKTFELAIGAEPGKGHIQIEPVHTSTGHLLNQATNSSQSVNIDTLDRFCYMRCIDAIDLLKVDVEGRELDVLVGAKTSRWNARSIPTATTTPNSSISARRYIRSAIGCSASMSNTPTAASQHRASDGSMLLS
jgi:FkbM family methyltransferase